MHAHSVEDARSIASPETGTSTLVQFLLEHGGAESLHVKNAMGNTPLSCARLFGPYPEVEAVLKDATRRHP